MLVAFKNQDKLKELTFFIQNTIGEVNGRVFVDSAPVLERVWAQKGGLGWRGKNSLLLQKNKGSFFFLAELILDLELTYDNQLEFYKFKKSNMNSNKNKFIRLETKLSINGKSI